MQVYFKVSLSKFANWRKIKVVIFLNVLSISKLCAFEQSTQVLCFRKLSKLNTINYLFKLKPNMIKSRIGLLMIHHLINENAEIKWSSTSFKFKWKHVHKISNKCRNNRNYNTFSASKETPIEPVIYERGTSML